jgi:hypothetical protein
VRAPARVVRPYGGGCAIVCVHTSSLQPRVAYGGSVVCAVSPAGAPWQTYSIILVECAVCFPRVVAKTQLFKNTFTTTVDGNIFASKYGVSLFQM